MRGSSPRRLSVLYLWLVLSQTLAEAIATNIDYYGKMVKRIRILSSLWWEEDAPLMSLFGLCFLGKTKHHKYGRASYSHRISQVWRETKGCMRRRPIYLKLQIQVLKVYRIYSKAQRVGYKRGQRIAV